MIKYKSDLFVKSDSLEWEEVAAGVKRKILGYDSELMMVHVLFQKDAIGSLHNHAHRQVTYVESGSFELNIDGVKKVLNKGDSFFIPPNIKHEAIALEQGCLIDIFCPCREDFLSENK